MPSPIPPIVSTQSSLVRSLPPDASPANRASTSAEAASAPQSPSTGASPASLRKTSKAARMGVAHAEPGRGSGTSANIAKLRASLRPSEGAEARSVTAERPARPSEETKPSESGWVVDESSWDAFSPTATASFSAFFDAPDMGPPSSLHEAPKSPRAGGVFEGPGSGSGTSANVAKLWASRGADAGKSSAPLSPLGSESKSPLSDWVVDESSWEAAFSTDDVFQAAPFGLTVDDFSQDPTYPLVVTSSLLSSTLNKTPPDAIPVSVPGAGQGLPNLLSSDVREDFDVFFSSLNSDQPYTIVQLPPNGQAPTGEQLQKLWGVLSDPSGPVKFVINKDGQLVIGDEGANDGLKHSVLANYIPGMERWTPQQRWDHLQSGVTNHNVVAAGALKLTDTGHGTYRLGYNNESGHYKPGPDSMWDGRVRTELQRVANGLKTHLNVTIDVGMQTDELRDGADDSV